MGNAYRGDKLLLQPLAQFTQGALTGYFNFYPDSDHVMRRYPLAKKHTEENYTTLTPSFVHAVLDAAGYEPLIDPFSNQLWLLGKEEPVALGSGLDVFKLPVASGAYDVYEYSDVLSGAVPAEEFEDAVVFIGISAAGAADNIHTPMGYLAGTKVLADIFYSVLSGKIPQTPSAVWQIMFSFSVLMGCMMATLLLPNQFNWLPVILIVGAATLLPHLLFRFAHVYLTSAATLFVLLLCGVLQLFYLRVLRENQRKQEMLMNMISCFVSAIDAKDPVTAGHSKRVSQISAQIAQKKGLGRREVENIRFAGLIHDVGKIGVSDAVLNKPGHFTPEEFAEMKRHPQQGVTIMEQAGLPEVMLSSILDHHERPDGTGYPNGKKAEELNIYTEIIKIADVYDALISKRQYKEPWPIEKVCDILYQGRGSEFNAELIDLFLEDIRPEGWKPGA